MEAMNGLFPVERAEEQLAECLEGCQAGDCPIQGNADRPLDQVKLATFYASDQICIYIEEVAKDHAGHPHIQQHRWEQFVIEPFELAMEGEVDDHQGPHQGIGEERQRFSANKDLD